MPASHSLKNIHGLPRFQTVVILLIVSFIGACTAYRPPTPGEVATKEAVEKLVQITQEALNNVEAYLASNNSKLVTLQTDLKLKTSTSGSTNTSAEIVLLSGKRGSETKNSDLIHITLKPQKSAVQKIMTDDEVVNFNLPSDDKQKLSTSQRLAGMVIAAIAGVINSGTSLEPSKLVVSISFETTITKDGGVNVEILFIKIGGGRKSSRSAGHELVLTFAPKKAPAECTYKICKNPDCSDFYCVKSG